MKDDNFDLVLAIPLKQLKGRKELSEGDLENIASSSLEKISNNSIRIGETEMNIKNNFYDKEKLKEDAGTFCKQIEEHWRYESVFRGDSNININRSPLVYGCVIIYKDEKENRPKEAECCYNFFVVLSELVLGKGSPKKKNVFNFIYFVVPDITHHDLTLLMDQSYEIWCNIDGKNYGKNDGFFNKYLKEIGYKYLGKRYCIVFSDSHQLECIKKGGETKLLNILAAEEYKSEVGYDHQLKIVREQEKFYGDYTMYTSYEAYASLYSYYYVIKEEGKEKDTFRKRIQPDQNDVSSEANMLFILETEIFKITACLALSDRIDEQMKEPDMAEIKEMFKRFINTRPLFEKLNYRYLGAQKEADFIHKQFRIGDILSDYDRKKELLKNYSEISSSITSNRNAKLLNCIGLVFAFVAGYEKLSPKIKEFIDTWHITWDRESIILLIVLLVIILIVSGLAGKVRKFFKIGLNALVRLFRR